MQILNLSQPLITASLILIIIKFNYIKHRHTGPVSFRGAEVSCPKIFSIACPENQVVLPEYYFFFLPENGYWKILGGLQPPPRTPMTLSAAEICFCCISIDANEVSQIFSK